MIWLQSPAGVPIGMTLPLHETITEQWRNGGLQRVTAEGARWEGDEFDLSTAAESGTPGASEPEPSEGEREAGDDPDAGGEVQEPTAPADGVTEPERPNASAPKQPWQDYAVALGACTADEAAAMTRQALIDLCTPPEADPLAGG
jgi:hypothetical protein